MTTTATLDTFSPPATTTARHTSADPVERYPLVWPTELDARGGTPPKPVPAILAALRLIPAGTTQYVRTRDYPADLLAALAKHGVETLTSALHDGTWRTAVMLRAA